MATAVRRNAREEPKEPWLTVAQAAKALGIARHTLLSRALAGELTVQTVAGRHFVSRASVEAALEGQGA